MPNNPLSAPGHDVDIETGNPMEMEREIVAKRRIRKIAERSQSLINELSDDRGVLVEQLMALYVERINQLIAGDAECQAYEKLMGTIKHTVSIGKKIVEDRAKGLVNL